MNVIERFRRILGFSGLLRIRAMYMASIFLLAGSSLTSGQKLELKFKHLTKDDGLPSGTVTCIFHDSRGYLWFGTNNGLSRYDGHNFVVYKNDPQDEFSLSENVITSIAEDSEGKIWVATNVSGVSVLDYTTGKFTRYSKDAPEGYRIRGKSVKCLYIDRHDNVLIGTAREGLNVYYKKSKSFSHFQANPQDPSSLQSNALSQIKKKSDGQFYISNESGSVEVFDLESGTFSRTVYDENPKPNISPWKPLLEDSNGNFWIGGSDGLNRINPRTGEVTKFTEEDELSSNIVSVLFEDEAGRVWIGTDGGGLNIFTPSTNSFEIFKNNPFDENSIRTNPVQDIYQDRGGTIWVATHSGGLNSYNPKREKFKTYSQKPGDPNSLNASLVLALHEGRDQKLWIGTDGGGLNLFDPKTETFTHYKHSLTNENSVGSNVISAVYEDHQGILWMGTYAGGLNSFNPGTGKFRRYFNDPRDPESLAKNSVWAIAEDSKKNLYIGMLGAGFDIFDREKGVFKHYKGIDDDESTLWGDYIRFIFEDSNKNIWIGTDRGLNLFDVANEMCTRFKHDPNDATTIAHRSVKSILEDKDGNLWIGTSNGISLYNKEDSSFIRHEVNDKLPNLLINGILQDESGHLWISTSEGLSRYNLDTKEIENFDKGDGLQGLEFSAGAAIKSKFSNKMFFGGVNGFSVFDPAAIVKSTREVEVVFNGIRLFDKPVNKGDTINGKVLLKKDLTITEEIILTHEENVVAIEFSALDYISPDKNLYAYKLEGFDESETITDAANRKVTYTNLDAGEYRFKVRATNHDGVWSDKRATLKITVLPPWWKTWWFRGLLGLAALLIIYGIYYWRFRILNKQKRMLQEEVNSHTGKLREVIEILRAKSEQISASGVALKRKSGLLAKDAKLQTENAKLIEGSIENVINHTKKNSDNAVRSNEISKNTVKELEKIREANENNIKENKVISNKVGILDEIFKQTNILAINASIEAARAGTYGSGFSIIAGEVKKLAERSKTASLEISSSAKNGSAETEKMEKLLLNFVPEIEKSVKLIKEISQSSIEQTSSVEIMTQSLMEFFKISRQNADISNEIYVISSELDELAKYLSDQMKKIKL